MTNNEIRNLIANYTEQVFKLERKISELESVEDMLNGTELAGNLKQQAAYTKVVTHLERAIVELEELMER